MNRLLKIDHLFFGLGLGIVFPLILYGIMLLLTKLSPEASFNFDTLKVIAITGNVILFRYYMVKKKMDNTGKGMLIATMIYAFLFFLLKA